MSEEVNQQLAEAQGYSGMKGLIAQAYQMSLGKTEKEAKENRNAMKELTDAMGKGLVKPDKIFPILVDLMKQASAEGTEAARRSPSAQEDRFWNRMEKGWENFTKGGGASGIANFWNDLTGSVGAWFEENGAWLGKQFEILIQRFKVFRIGLTDLFKYLWDGENTGFVTWLAQEKGIDLSKVRAFISDFWQGLKGIVMSVAAAVGLVDEQTGKISFEEFGNRLRNFGSSVAKAISMVMEMFSGFARVFELSMEISSGGYVEMFKSFIPGTDAFSKRMEITGLLIRAIGSGFSATAEAGKAVAAPLIPSTSSLYNPKTEEPPFVYGDYPLVSPSNTFVGSRLSGDSGFSGAPIRRRIIPQEVISNPGTRMSMPTAADALPTSSVAQGGQSFGLNAQKIAPLDINVNVKMEVSGDPEQMKLYASEEVSRGIAERVPKLLDESFDYKFSSKMKSVITDAPLN